MNSSRNCLVPKSKLAVRQCATDLGLAMELRSGITPSPGCVYIFYYGYVFLNKIADGNGADTSLLTIDLKALNEYSDIPSLGDGTTCITCPV